MFVAATVIRLPATDVPVTSTEADRPTPSAGAVTVRSVASCAFLT